ncbi:MAG: DNA recombination protein RmuC [Pusillimonas sp.]
MNPYSIDLTGLLLGIAGMLVGAGLSGLFLRGVLATVRAERRAAQDLAAQRADYLAQTRAELDLASRRVSSITADKDLAERQLARLESTVQGLRERLDEGRRALAASDAERQQLVQQSSRLQNELVELRAIHTEKLASFQAMKEGLDESRAQLRTEFQNLASQVLEEKGKTFTQSSQSALDTLLRPFRDQIEQFQRRVNQVHDEALRGNVSLSAEIKRVMDVGLRISTEANTLASALKGDKKTTGNWGEVQLERTLELAGLIKGDHYEPQARFKDALGNDRQPDFVVKLPDHRHVVIDSKVSLVDYDRAIAAETETDRKMALDAHVKAVRNHIDDLGRKDYSNLTGMRSPSFVLMFMPIEPAYIEALRHNKDLFDYGYQRNVILVSHTTLMPILKTVANLWMVARSNEQAHELSNRAGELYNQVVVVAERLKKLGGTLDTVSRHYNETVTAVAGQQGLYGKASRFSELSSRANKTMPVLEPLHADFEEEKLTLIVGDQPAPQNPPCPDGADEGMVQSGDHTR